MRFLIISLLFLWTALSGWWYICEIRCACSLSNEEAINVADKRALTLPPAKKPEKLTPVPKKSTPTIGFECNKAAPVLSNRFKRFKEALIARKGNKNVLEIIGLYSNSEINQSSFANLGLARANEIKALFGDQVAVSNMTVKGRSHRSELDCSGPFEGSEIRWRLVSQQVKELEDKTLIYFSKNSIEQEASKEIDNYLKQLAAKMKEEQTWTISLVGHTDDIGEAKTNEQLGLKRAETVKHTLVAFGVEPNRITCHSKGETLALAPNDTDSGREQNRRVELKIKR